jgi:crotonobetainyl-CoA:carnitine CoA-transferase CaiB-like acyl-CoA transferase
MKVESSSRLDGARLHPAFYRALHPEDEDHVMVELTAEEGRSKLRGLIEDADVVIEASRPRALRQLGAGSDQMPPRPGRVWLSITGYGRREPGSQWIAFGDDAAVAGGLVGRTEEGGPEFCADAVADPVTGLFGAAAVLRSLEVGGGHLIDLALAGSAAAIARATEPFDAGDDSTGAKPWMS